MGTSDNPIENLVMFRAALETRHFSFEAFGETEKHARAMMAELWADHCIEYEQPNNFDEFEDGVNVMEFSIGRGYRDGSEVKVRNKVTAEMMDEISLARKDIRGIDWENIEPYGRPKDGRSFAVPVKAIFGPNEVDQDEVGPYSGTMIIDVQNGKLTDYSVGDWQRDEEDDDELSNSV
jgi:hypothetical protein